MKPLKKIVLRNFRCFENFEMNLDPRLTVLVAENGSGKTAILDAIALGLSPILTRLSSANQRLKAPGVKDTDFRVVKTSTSRDGQPKFSAAQYVQVFMETTDHLFWDYWKASSRWALDLLPPNKVGQSHLNRYLDAIAINSSLGSDLTTFPVVAYYGTSRAFLNIPGRLHPSYADYSQQASALIGALDARSNFKECLQWFDAAEANELRMNKGCNEQNFEELPALAAVRQVVCEILGKGISSPRFDMPSHKLIVDRELPDGQSVSLRVDQLSQGYQAMLALAMDFARRMTQANPDFVDQPTDSDPFLGPMPLNAPAIMLVDEIDLHLHPSWQQRVLGDLMRVFPKTQFIVTTHSPQVLTTVPAKCIRVISKDGNIRIPFEQTKGDESASVMASVMGTDPVPGVEEARWLSKYKALIQTGQMDSEIAINLRQKLDEHFGPRHPLVQECDRLVRFEKFKRNLHPTTEGTAKEDK